MPSASLGWQPPHDRRRLRRALRPRDGDTRRDRRL